MLEELRPEAELEADVLPAYDRLRRRPFRILVGCLVGLFLLTVACMVAYILGVRPGSRGRELAQISQVETQNAALALTLASSETSTPRPSATATAAPTLSPTALPPTPTPSPTPTPEPSATPPPTATPTTTPLSEVILTDSFGGGSGWVIQDAETFELGYAEGGYRMFVNIFFAEIWSVRGQVYGDVRIEVDATSASGPEDGFFGLMCRFQNDGNYYALVLDRGGEARIFKKEGGEVSDLATQDGQADPLSETASRLRADCIGDTLKLFLDDQLVLDVNDDTFPEGNVGLVAGALAVPGTEVIFDNFVLAVP